MENATEILRVWRKQLADSSRDRFAPSSDILETILAQLTLLLKPASPGKPASISDQNAAEALRMTSELARLSPDLLHVYLVCRESLQEFVKSCDFVKKLTAANRKLLLLKIDAAFSILIHHQIHAFSKAADLDTNSRPAEIAPLPPFAASLPQQSCSA